MMDKCREAFEAWYQRVGGPKGAVKIDAGVGFQAGWNARPGIIFDAVIKANEERTAAAIATPFDQARFSAANLQLMEAVDAMCAAIKSSEND